MVMFWFMALMAEQLMQKGHQLGGAAFVRPVRGKI
jgi:hypothetical protein